MEGLYYSIGDESISLLRFYTDGLVLGAEIVLSEIDSIGETQSWFNREKYESDFSRGNYEIKNKSIFFKDKSIIFKLTSKYATVEYSGKIFDSGKILLNIHSITSGYKTQSIFKIHH